MAKESVASRVDPHGGSFALACIREDLDLSLEPLSECVGSDIEVVDGLQSEPELRRVPK